MNNSSALNATRWAIAWLESDADEMSEYAGAFSLHTLMTVLAATIAPAIAYTETGRVNAADALRSHLYDLMTVALEENER